MFVRRGGRRSAAEAFRTIEATPKPIRFRPAFRRQFCGSIDVMPVRRVMLRQVARLPANPQGSKHLDVSVGVRLIRIEQCAVPVKQHSLKGLVRQHETIVADARSGWRGPQIRGVHESWYHSFSPHSPRPTRRIFREPLLCSLPRTVVTLLIPTASAKYLR